MIFKALNSIKTFTGLLLFIFFLHQHATGQITPNRRLPSQQSSEEEREGEEKKQKNDSIEYGPSTTHFTFERNIKYNQPAQYTIDTMINDVYNYAIVEKYDNMLQDLGNIGTATHPVFYTFPSIIGARPGFNAYDPYFILPEDIAYYNTQSPHTKLELNFGGLGRSMAGVTFAGNITPEWNVGFRYVRRRADKQLGAERRKGDTQSTSDAIVVFTSYESKKQTKEKTPRYQLLSNFSFLKHNVEESGGIEEEEGDELEDLFRYQDAQIWLRGAFSRERRNNIHIFHQYTLSKNLQIYQSIDRSAQTNTFKYNNLSADTAGYYFKRTLLNQDSTFDETKFSAITHEAGIKGDLAGLFYSFYHKFRTPRFSYNHLDGKYASFEQYLGGNIRYDLTEKIAIKGEGEFNSFDIFKIRGAIETPLLDASYQRTRSIPSYLERTYWGNHNFWFENNFAPTGADQIAGALKLNLASFQLRPFLSITNVNKPVYFVRDTIPGSRQAFPVQAADAVQILSPGVDIGINFLKYLNLRSKVMYTTVTGKASEAYEVPSLFINAKLYYNRIFLNGKIIMETGFDAHYRSTYFSYDYDIATQQFFVQKEFEIPHYLIVDFYFALKVRRARIYIKVPQINEGIGELDGYFITPIYTGQQRTFDIGISWPFFD